MVALRSKRRPSVAGFGGVGRPAPSTLDFGSGNFVADRDFLLAATIPPDCDRFLQLFAPDFIQILG